MCKLKIYSIQVRGMNIPFQSFGLSRGRENIYASVPVDFPHGESLEGELAFEDIVHCENPRNRSMNSTSFQVKAVNATPI